MKKINILYLLLIGLILGSSLPASAQDFINEDFLDNIENNAAAMWNEKLPAFEVQRMPEKYKEESGVILVYRRSVNIDKKSRFGFYPAAERSLIFMENVRFKIGLQDKSAVETFSTIYFRYSDKTDGFSARITKPDGETRTVGLNEAVQVEGGSIPEFFQSFFDQQSGGYRRYYKVAIPGLEPGDILEYVTVTKSKLDVFGSGYIEFTPQYEICSKKYPILFNQIIIETDDKSFFKSMSYNGAPEFKKETASEEGFFRFIFTDNDRATEKDVNFINEYKQYPLVKFQVIYANNEKTKGALIGEKGEIKTGFTKEELAKKAWEDFAKTGSNSYGEGATVQAVADALWSELKKNGAKDWSEDDFIKYTYYRLRNLVMNRDTYLSDKTAAYLFGNILSNRNIKSDLIISASNKIGQMKDVLFDDEIRYVVRIKDKLYFNITDHSNPGDLAESLVGCESYLIGEPDKKGNQEIAPFTLPGTVSADNASVYDFTVAVDKDMNNLVVSRTSKFTGISKTRNIDEALRYTTYMLDDYKNYNGNAPTDKMNERQEEEYLKTVKALKDNFKEMKPEYVKNQLEKEYGKKVNSKGFTIASGGRTWKNQELVFTEDFEVGGFIRKAGKKYLVNLIGLVGGQLQIKKDERNRKHDISMGYPRSIAWNFKLKIPEGYTAEGMNELAISVDNSSGSYSCAAEQVGNEIVLTIKKVYKQNFLPRDKWSEVLAFVDAAYNHLHKYILLKPKA